MDAGIALKRLRKKQGLSQTDLSVRSGVLQTTISAIERGTDPTGKTLMSLAKALNTTTDELLNYRQEVVK